MLASLLGLTATGDEVIIAPLLARQILWINPVTDGAPTLALGLDPADPGVMRQQPCAQDSGVIMREMGFGIVFVGIIMAKGPLRDRPGGADVSAATGVSCG